MLTTRPSASKKIGVASAQGDSLAFEKHSESIIGHLIWRLHRTEVALAIASHFNLVFRVAVIKVNANQAFCAMASRAFGYYTECQELHKLNLFLFRPHKVLLMSALAFEELILNINIL